MPKCKAAGRVRGIGNPEAEAKYPLFSGFRSYDTLVFVSIVVVICVLNLLSATSTLTTTDRVQLSLQTAVLAKPSSVLKEPSTSPTSAPPTSQSILNDSLARQESREQVLSCPGWNPKFSLKFESMCGPWVNRFSDWNTNLSNVKKQPVQYSCTEEQYCNGLGDRFSGVHSVLEIALKYKRPMRIAWANLTDVFESTCLMPEPWLPQDADQFKPYCAWPKKGNRQLDCAPLAHSCRKKANGVMISSIVTGCPTENTCKPIHKEPLTPARKDDSLTGRSSKKNVEIEEFGTVKQTDKLMGGTAANMFGCAMRALFQITDSFRELKVRWIHNRVITIMTVNQVEKLMKQYFTISIHFRIGDSAFNADPEEIMRRWGEFVPIVNCASTVERYVRDKEHNKGLPVRWVFSSDSPAMRQRVLHDYGDKVMMIDQDPHHISTDQIDGTYIAQTFTEWYLLSLGNRLVVNRRNEMNTLFEGRLSGFSKTLWVFQLKHLYYDAGTCKLRTMHLDGNWESTSVRACDKVSKTLKDWKLPQPHLAYATNVTQNSPDNTTAGQ